MQELIRKIEEGWLLIKVILLMLISPGTSTIIIALIIRPHPSNLTYSLSMMVASIIAIVEFVFVFCDFLHELGFGDNYTSDKWYKAEFNHFRPIVLAFIMIVLAFISVYIARITPVKPWIVLLNIPGVMITCAIIITYFGIPRRSK